MIRDYGIVISLKKAYKAHAVRLNWTRPRYSKIGWRGLNRKQKQIALLNYLFAQFDTLTKK